MGARKSIPRKDREEAHLLNSSPEVGNLKGGEPIKSAGLKDVKGKPFHPPNTIPSG